MALTGLKTHYFVARTKESSNESSLIRTNSFTGLPSGVSEFDQADAYDNFESAKETAQWLDSAPAFIKQDYDYYVIQKDEDSFRLDADGNRVESDEEPSTEEPTE